MQIAGYIFMGIGGGFLLLGVVGVIRMPDLFNKIQAGTKATTLGLLSLLVGMVFLQPSWWFKLLLIAVFVLITAPLGSHNLARAAARGDEEIRIDGVNDLKGIKKEGQA